MLFNKNLEHRKDVTCLRIAVREGNTNKIRNPVFFIMINKRLAVLTAVFYKNAYISYVPDNMDFCWPGKLSCFKLQNVFVFFKMLTILRLLANNKSLSNIISNNNDLQ